MSLYRTVSIQMWSDAAFRALSPMAQRLWFYLLTGPETTAIPGVVPVGKATLAEVLGTVPQTVSTWFRELENQGMATADWDARLVWLPKALKHREPANPNVVSGWATFWVLVPECELKTQIHQRLAEYCAARGTVYETALKRLGEPFGERLPKQKEKEKEKEKEKTPQPPASGGSDSSEPVAVVIPAELDTPDFRAAWSEWKAERRLRRMKPYTPRGEQQQLVKLSPFGPDAAIAAIRESIAQGWQGLFPKTPSARPANASGPLSAGRARVEEILRQARGETPQEAT